MRVLLISHTCQSRTEGQPKAACLAQMPGLELCLLAPARWKRYGQWRAAEPPISDAFTYEVGEVRWPWAGPAQNYLHWYPGLKDLLLRFKPDVIDLWEEPWSLVSVQACRLRNRHLPATRVISETEQNINKALPFPFEMFRSYTLRHADYVIGRSGEAVAVVREKGYTGPAEVVPNAVDTSLFRPLDRAAARRQEGIDEEAFVVGYVGRLVEAKGIGELIDAVAGASRPMQLVLVGAGEDEAALRQRAADWNAQAKVRFLGKRDLEALPTLMSALDVLVLPSRTTASWKEQFGRVLIEAQACAVPVIGSDSGAIPEVVGDGGLVVRERDAVGLRAALERLAGDPDEARRLGRNGYEQVHAHCTWQRVAERMHAIYERVARRPRNARTAEAASARTASGV